ncbi:hypothetical protein MOHU_08160 [Moorella humiferrea]|uniref:Uncharacterized protein n=1 Tax=Neomoorella humiferrea TaxID=676965 RepID=A0A2T0AVA2_9FIRM|nr:hypothetical protein MOHU_08160 [Moorella humiferrea]
MTRTHAEENGRWVARQGDIYIVELQAGQNNLDDLPDNHSFDSETRTFYHKKHAPVAVPPGVKAVRVYRQTQIHPLGGRDYAD